MDDDYMTWEELQEWLDETNRFVEMYNDNEECE